MRKTLSFEFLDSITRADVAFLARDKNIEALFLSCADAVVSIMIENYHNIEKQIKKLVILDNPSLDLLLYNFLEELLFFKDSEQLFLRPTSIDLSSSIDNHSLRATLEGEPINRGKHLLNVDVKSITMHKLSVKKIGNEWHATVILDV